MMLSVLYLEWGRFSEEYGSNGQHERRVKGRQEMVEGMSVAPSLRGEPRGRGSGSLHPFERTACGGGGTSPLPPESRCEQLITGTFSRGMFQRNLQNTFLGLCSRAMKGKNKIEFKNGSATSEEHLLEFPEPQFPSAVRWS